MSKQRQESKDENIYDRIRREAREKQEEERERKRLQEEQMERLYMSGGGLTRL
jgi:hypothetical protein